MFFQY